MDKKLKRVVAAGLFVIATLAVLSIAGGILYVNGQSQQRESLKKAFYDELNETNAIYGLIAAYPSAGNKNYLEDYRAWIDGHRARAANYTAHSPGLIEAGTEYQKMLDASGSDYANVSQALASVNETVRELDRACDGFETDYRSRLASRDNTSDYYALSLNRSGSLYDAAQRSLHDDANYTRYGGYRLFLEACSRNISYYNDSIGLVASAGANYQAYLKGQDFSAIDQTIASLRGKVPPLQGQYAELRKKIPNVTVVRMEPSLCHSPDKGFYQAVSFQLQNLNYPMQIKDIVAHFKLIDHDTGAVRSTADVPVTMSTGWSDFFTAILPCENGRVYDITYTLTYDY